MKNYILYVCALITLGFASSCKQPTDFDTDRWNDKDTNNYPAPAELAGEWILVSFEQFYVIAGQTYSLNFKNSKDVSGNANCNTFTSTYILGTTPIGNTTEKAITFKNITSSKINCGTADMESKYLDALSTAKQYSVSSELLEISYGNTKRMIFKRKQAPNTDYNLLKGTEWTLVRFQNFNSPSEWLPIAQQEKTDISFTTDSNASVRADCNYEKLYYTIGSNVNGTPDTKISFTGFSGTTVNCGTGSFGERFVNALKGAKQFYQYGDSLEMTYAQGGATARMMFIRKQPVNSGVTVIDSGNVVSELPTGNVPSDPYTLISFVGQTNSNTKIMKVSFSGGCGSHYFMHYGKVSSGGIELLITHAAYDPCDAIVQKDVTLDLSAYIAAYKKVTGKTSGQVTFVFKSTGNSMAGSFIHDF